MPRSIRGRKHFWYGEGEPPAGGGEPPASGGGGEPPAGGGGGSEPPKDKMFTQEEVNRIMANNRRQLQLKVQELESQLEEVKLNSWSEEDRVRLQSRVQELSNSLKTKEELAAQEQEKIKKEAEQKISDLQNQLEVITNRYTNETIQRNLMDAAVAHDAFSPEQIVAILRPKTSFVEVVDDDGKPTGDYTVKVKFPGKDKKGADTVLDLTPTEAVKIMRETPEEYGNLFKSGVKNGLGGTGNVSGNDVDLSKLSTEEYMKRRREGKLKL